MLNPALLHSSKTFDSGLYSKKRKGTGKKHSPHDRGKGAALKLSTGKPFHYKDVTKAELYILYGYGIAYKALAVCRNGECKATASSNLYSVTRHC